MEIKKGDKVKVLLYDYEKQNWLNRLWDGPNTVIKEATITSIIDKGNGFAPMITFEVDGFLPYTMFQYELRNAMVGANPHIFDTELESLKFN